MKSEEKIFMHRAGRKKVKNAHTYISNNKNNKKTLHEREKKKSKARTALQFSRDKERLNRHSLSVSDTRRG